MGECGQCKFFRVADERDDRGNCERFPPGWFNNTASRIYIRGWPVTAVGDRCGEFRQYRGE
jgi:hypothetical protein